MPGKRGTYQCSFCGKNQDQVQRLIAGPNHVCICNECVALCNEIIAEEAGHPSGKPGSSDPSAGGWRVETHEPADGDK